MKSDALDDVMGDRSILMKFKGFNMVKIFEKNIEKRLSNQSLKQDSENQKFQ